MAQLLGNTRIYGPASTDGRLLVANTSPVAATSNTTGSLIVTGGAGISGNLYADLVYSSGQEVIGTSLAFAIALG